MNDCTNICEYISLYADGEIEIDTLKYNEILEHIRTCEDCNDFFLECENILSKLKTLKTDPPADLHNHIMSAINDEINGHIVQIKPTHKSKYITITGMVACLALVVIYGNFFGDNASNVSKRSSVPMSTAYNDTDKNILNEEYALTIVADGNVDSLNINASLIYEDENSKYFEVENSVSTIDVVMDTLANANLNPTITYHNNESAEAALMIINFPY